MRHLDQRAEEVPLAGAPARRARPAPDLLAVLGWALLVVTAWAVGTWLNAHGAGVHAPTPPLYAGYHPHWGPGTPASVAVAALVVLRGPELAARLAWRPLLTLAYLAALAWTFALALIDGWQVGVAGRLEVPGEYLDGVGLVGGDVGAFLRGFSGHILAFQPGALPTHVAAHPPLAVLLFTALARLGLPGGGPAGVLCILLGASAPVAVAITLRALGGPSGERLARAGLPFGVLTPAAIWIGVSADGMYAGVLAWAVCAYTLASTPARAAEVPLAVSPAGTCPVMGPRGVACALGAGMLMGGCLYFSYGLTLGGLLVLAVVVRTRRVAPLGVAGVGVAAVVAAFTLAGFWWFSGYRLAALRYAQPLQLGSADRSYGYWVWAAPAAFAVVLGPAAVAGLRRLLTGPRAAPEVADVAGRRALTALCGAALLAVLLADLSGLSRGEVERIWLPFAVWLPTSAGLLPARRRRWWLLAQASLALAVNHLLVPPW